MKADAVPEATRAMLRALWEKNLPIVRSRIEELQRAADEATSKLLTTEARVSAEGTAHKLAGSLGMFGYKRGTEIARELEQILEGSQPLDGQQLQELTHQLQAELEF